MSTATRPQSGEIAAALTAIRAVAECIREAGSIPAGHLYAALMTKGCTLQTFERIVGMLTSNDHGAAVVEKRGDLLVWVG